MAVRRDSDDERRVGVVQGPADLRQHLRKVVPLDAEKLVVIVVLEADIDAVTFAVLIDHAVVEAEQLQVVVPPWRIEAGPPTVGARREIESVDAVAENLPGHSNQALLHGRIPECGNAVVETRSIPRTPVLARRFIPDRVDQREIVLARVLEFVPVAPRPDWNIVLPRRLHRRGERIPDIHHLRGPVPVLRLLVVRIHAFMVECRHNFRMVVGSPGGVAPVQKRQPRPFEQGKKPIEILFVNRPLVKPGRVGGIEVEEGAEGLVGEKTHWRFSVFGWWFTETK